MRMVRALLIALFVPLVVTAPARAVTVPYNFELVVPRGAQISKTVQPGSTAQFEFWMCNTGTAADTYAIRVSQTEGWPASLSSNGYSVERVDVGVDASNPFCSLDLSKKNIVPVTLSVWVPEGVTRSETDLITVQACSANAVPELCLQGTEFRVQASPSYGVTLSAPQREQSGHAGQVVVYPLAVQNTGNMPDSYDIQLIIGDWRATVIPTVLSLEAFETAQIEVSVNIPPGAENGSLDYTGVMVTSRTQVDLQASITLATGVHWHWIALPWVVWP